MKNCIEGHKTESQPQTRFWAVHPSSNLSGLLELTVSLALPTLLFGNAVKVVDHCNSKGLETSR